MKKLSNEQINELLTSADGAVRESRSLSAVFKRFAEENDRAKGGIRNLYYKLVKESKTDKELLTLYPVLKGLKAEKSRAFMKEEEDEIFEKIREGVAGGKSARRVIKELAGGDEKLALRYQNKYRNMLKERGLSRTRGGRDSNYDRVRQAIDELFDKVLKKRSEREEALIDENKVLKERLTAAEEALAQNKVKEFFAEKAGE